MTMDVSSTFLSNPIVSNSFDWTDRIWQWSDDITDDSNNNNAITVNVNNNNNNNNNVNGNNVSSTNNNNNNDNISNNNNVNSNINNNIDNCANNSINNNANNINKDNNNDNNHMTRKDRNGDTNIINIDDNNNDINNPDDNITSSAVQNCITEANGAAARTATTNTTTTNNNNNINNHLNNHMDNNISNNNNEHGGRNNVNSNLNVDYVVNGANRVRRKRKNGDATAICSNNKVLCSTGNVQMKNSQQQYQQQQQQHEHHVLSTLKCGSNNANLRAVTQTTWSDNDLPCVINLNVGNNICSYGEVHLNSEYDISDDLLNFTLEPFKQESVLLNNCPVQHCPSDSSIVSNATSQRNFHLDSTEHSPMNSTFLGAPLSSSPSSASSSPEYFIARNDSIVEPDTSIDDRCNERSNYVGVVPCLSNSASRDSISSDSVIEFKNSNYGRFQYVLCAATSVAMKLNEESLTYLNQGQPYEIKLKKLGDLASCKGKIFKSVIRILFHDRRLRYIEREQMNAWQLSRPGDRLIEIDKPLSYGLLNTIEDPKNINSVQLFWDPTKEVGVFIKVNCISTEFTAKKHGGEKGVSFRLHIETYIEDLHPPRSIHSGSCQIKVFKLKGADRKHKQDREKVMKKPLLDREKYQQSYDCTVFTEGWLNEPLSSSILSTAVNSRLIGFKEIDRINGVAHIISERDKNALNGQDVASSNSVSSNNVMLTAESSSADMQQWLRLNRFGEQSSKFENFTAADMFNLSKEDYINLCGLSDGIRLYNTLPILPRLTLYINVVDSCDDYYPVYLKSLTCQELTNNIAPLAGLHPSQVHNIYILGPHSCKIIVTDNFVHNIKDETFFTLKLTSDGEGNRSFSILLKIVTTSSVTIPTSQQSVA